MFGSVRRGAADLLTRQAKPPPFETAGAIAVDGARQAGAWCRAKDPPK
jgi:hypothetical protein